MLSADCFLQILRVLRHLLPGLQSHVRFLPIRTVAGKFPATPLFARIISGAHRVHFHLEDRLYRFFDLGLRRLWRNLEHQRVLLFLDAEALLGNYWPANDLICGFHLRYLRRFLSTGTGAPRRFLWRFTFTFAFAFRRLVL